jgi:hypothetical protein
MLAKAIAGEAGVPFFFSSGSQFEEVYVGLGAKRIRELFEAAKKRAPAIVFIDEIDAVGGTRRLKDQSALKMTLNELLVQLDGFDDNDGIIVIGATNFMESLDKALLRPGRFDKVQYTRVSCWHIGCVCVFTPHDTSCTHSHTNNHFLYFPIARDSSIARCWWPQGNSRNVCEKDQACQGCRPECLGERNYWIQWSRSP